MNDLEKQSLPMKFNKQVNEKKLGWYEVVYLLVGLIFTVVIVFIGWNYLAPVFGMNQIDFWQAGVLTILCRTLFMVRESSHER